MRPLLLDPSASIAVLTGSTLSRIGRLQPLAHHPDCYRYDHHLIRVGARSFCLGCTCMGIGISLGLAAFAFLRESDARALLASGALLTAPTLLQPYLQWKPYKVLARTLLGGGSALFVATTIFALPLTLAGVGWRASMALIFAAIYRLLSQLRLRRLDDPCSHCSHGSKPFCYHYLPEFRAWERSAASDDDRALALGLIATIESGSHQFIPPERIVRRFRPRAASSVGSPNARRTLPASRHIFSASSSSRRPKL